MGGTPQAVVYERTVASATQQTATFRDLRGRAGTVFSAAAVTTGFLGGQALGEGKPFTGLAWAAVVAFVVVGALTLLVLWPWPWLSALSSRIMLEDIATENLSEADLHAFLSGILERNTDSNQRLLDRLFWVFRLACVVLVVEVVLWLALLATR